MRYPDHRSFGQIAAVIAAALVIAAAGFVSSPTRAQSQQQDPRLQKKAPPKGAVQAPRKTLATPGAGPNRFGPNGAATMPNGRMPGPNGMPNNARINPAMQLPNSKAGPAIANPRGNALGAKGATLPNAKSANAGPANPRLGNTR